MAKSGECLILSMPTHDGRAVPKSVMDLMGVASILKRRFLLNAQTGTGLANTRQKCIDAIREMFPGENEAYMFWLDSDMVLMEDPKRIAGYITEAERIGASFTTNCRSIDGNTGKISNTIVKGDPGNYEAYTDEELRNAKPLETRCAYSGLAVCYIKTPLDYRFRTEGHDLEDFLFFKDNRIDLKYAPISNMHIKSINLSFDHTKI
ncbi:MAG: hypothetical protein KGI06_03535 [Candidatus Micrarchaeota archaeon]|nr:hypothetical protein [Candidatus Micrarchaeota archaeon]